MDALHLAQLLGGGSFLGELFAAVEATAAEVVETGQAGTVSVSIKVSPQDGAEDAHMLNLASSVKRTPPTKKERSTWVFSFDGQLHRQDPRQLSLEFRAVEGGSQLRVPEDPGTSVREITS